MVQFIYGSALNTELETIINYAKRNLLLVSPYVKLHERTIVELRRRKADNNLQISLLFGKNEDDARKSINKEDIDFLKSFPNIQICYQRNLHAKFYASDTDAIITSMNLYQYSQNSNIEVGVIVSSNSDLYKDSYDYFHELIEGSNIIFKKEPEYESAGLLGLSKNYIGSRVKIDHIDDFFQGNPISKPTFTKQSIDFKRDVKQPEPKVGYCIRTGVKIPFNPEKPFCNEAYQSWAQFKNPDYKEKYDHLTGEPSNGKTSMRKPML